MKGGFFSIKIQILVLLSNLCDNCFDMDKLLLYRMYQPRRMIVLLVIITVTISIFFLLFFFYYFKQKEKLINPITSTPIKKQLGLPRVKTFSLDEIFQYRTPLATEAGSKKDRENEYVLIATGDVIPARSVNTTMVRKNNFLYPFEKTADFLKEADIVFINLETPLFSGCKPTIEGMVFCGDEKAVEGLNYAHVKVANLANNHAGDYGISGINKTVKLLEDSGISVTGTGEPAILPVKNKKFGFLGYNDIEKKEGITWADIEKIKKDIESLKPQVNFIVVAFHFGVEYTAKPTERQVELSHAAIDAGADLIIGNHPHWVQAVEIYKNKFITYAHGNFVFDQMWSQETREGVIGRYVFDETGLVDVSFYPVIIENYSQPRFAKESEAVKILQRMKEVSNSF